MRPFLTSLAINVLVLYVGIRWLHRATQWAS
jgi:hypothetical protein